MNTHKKIFLGLLVAAVLILPSSAFALMPYGEGDEPPNNEPPGNPCSLNSPSITTGGITITGSTARGTFTNTSADCTYKIGIASYKINDQLSDYTEFINAQVLNDSDYTTVGPGASVEVSASIPSCDYQVDLYAYKGTNNVPIPPDFWYALSTTHRLFDYQMTGALVSCFRPTCSASPSTVAPNTNTTLTGSGGSAGYPYTWSGGGTPATGSGTTWATQWANPGTKTVTVTRAGQSNTCQVTVGGDCDYQCTLGITPSSGAPGASFTFNVQATGDNGYCSGAGTNRKFYIDYTNDGTYDATTPWTGCYESTCKDGAWTSAPYSSPGSYTAKGKMDWQNNPNGTVTRTCTAPVTISSTSYTLTINKVADPVTGDGTNYADVTSVDGQISCLGACNTDTGSYAAGATIDTITTITPPGTWVGLGAGSDPACADPMTMPARNVTCNMVFGLSQAPVCSPATQTVTTGQQASFTASAGTGTYSWSGGGTPSTGSGASWSTTYSTTGTKTVTVNSGGLIDTCSVTVTTVPPTNYTLTVTKAGTGSGTVTSSPAGISCGADCTESYSSGTSVTMTPTPAAGSTFAGWSGTGCTTGTVSMTTNRNCTATFNASVTNYTLTVTKAGTGSGTVTAPAGTGDGISCGTNCTEAYGSGTPVTMTPTATLGSTFAGWSGLGCTTGTVTMSANRTCTATFNLSQLSCAAVSPDVVVGDYARFNASGGTGSYSWSGGGIPATGNSNPFVTQYTSTGLKTVTVTSGTQNAQCSVNIIPVPASVCQVNVADVCGQIRVTSNIGTTWRITGADGKIIDQTEDAGTTPVVYDKTVCGMYSITNIPERAGTAPVVSPADSGDLVQGGVLEFNINYAAPVDLKANGKDSGVEVVQGTPAYLTWTTTETIEPGSCVASNDRNQPSWDGSKADKGEQNSDPIDAKTIFTLTCYNAKGAEFSDSVDVSPRPPVCNNDKDDDFDGFFDWDGAGITEPDPGCDGNPTKDSEDNAPECSDGINNDTEDEDIDYPADIGCEDRDDNDESNASTIVTDCNDGLNNDGDTNEKGVEMVDHESVTPTGYVPDPGCTSVLDPSEVEDPDIREI